LARHGRATRADYLRQPVAQGVAHALVVEALGEPSDERAGALRPVGVRLAGQAAASMTQRPCSRRRRPPSSNTQVGEQLGRQPRCRVVDGERGGGHDLRASCPVPGGPPALSPAGLIARLVLPRAGKLAIATSVGNERTLI